jgi:hypothetical protein
MTLQELFEIPIIRAPRGGGCRDMPAAALTRALMN